MNKLTVEAKTKYLNQVHAFLRTLPEQHYWRNGDMGSLELAVEEVFVNICHYAYKGETGEVTIVIEKIQQPPGVKICMVDGGAAYNPLEQKLPDISLNAWQRPVGGLGVYFVREIMDQVIYSREGNENQLTMVKYLESPKKG